jgi:hypothetical protein
VRFGRRDRALSRDQASGRESEEAEPEYLHAYYYAPL